VKFGRRFRPESPLKCNAVINLSNHSSNISRHATLRAAAAISTLAIEFGAGAPSRADRQCI
jgi:hypothetical protein